MIEEVSVAILQYNPDWIKLKRTILSVIRQEGIKIQIIISDDGSVANHFEEIEQLMGALKFTDYRLVSSEHNNGTVINTIRALKECSYKTVKLISPGDYLYREDSLARCVAAFISNGWDISFGDAVYYSFNTDLKIYRIKHNPTNLSAYKKNNSIKNKQLNYLFLKDYALGASCLINRERYLEYLENIKNHVIYAEDLTYKLMIFDGIDFHYFPETVVWYEYGSGISTQKKTKWDVILKKDDLECDNVITSMSPTTRVSRKYQRLIKTDRKFNYNTYVRQIFKTLICPQLIYWKIKKTLFPYYTPSEDEVDCSFLYKICDECNRI